MIFLGAITIPTPIMIITVYIFSNQMHFQISNNFLLLLFLITSILNNRMVPSLVVTITTNLLGKM